ncbi:MAG: alanine/glycine:cation symporter family protein [Pseudomonadota bacterium]|nr:alanine/glycine:cation symporter family protein [Pseudomonadota bacterium]
MKRNISKFFLIFLAFFNPSNLYAGIDENINNLLAPISESVSSIVFYSLPLGSTNVELIVIWLILGGLFCTFYFKFVNFSAFSHSIALVRGKFSSQDSSGEVSHFRALATALSGTVGLGNIGGVAVAISLGGPGATFWMILSGLLGMSLKFCECTLGVKYRNLNPDGTVSGGAMYYLSKGLSEKGMPLFGKFLAYMFAVFCVFASLGGGNMFQVNQSLDLVIYVSGGEGGFLDINSWVYGAVFAVLLGVVIIGGIKRIAAVTSRLVPGMAIIYIISAIIILIVNAQYLPDAIRSIFVGAFSPEGVTGGFLGVLILGFRRAVFSNEAGIGSAPIAHSAVKTKEPITEGIVSVLEPFIDTVVICTITALVIVTTGVFSAGEGIEGARMTSEAFGSVLPWFPYILALVAILFAFSTAISWSYYGVKAITFIFGERKFIELTYKIIFCLFAIVGASLDLTKVIDLSDSSLFLMAIPNLIGVYLLASVVKKEFSKYKENYLN